MSREGDWMCPSPSCQHLNFKRRDSCQRCSCPKYGGETDIMASSYVINRNEALAGDWYCTAMNCRSHNYASRISCYRCSTPKDGYGGSMMGSGGFEHHAGVVPGWKTGDWICTRCECGAHNYACRMECFKCKTPKILELQYE